MALTRPSFIDKTKCDSKDLENLGSYLDSGDHITKAIYVFGIICIVLAALVVILGLLVVLLRYKENNGFFTKPVSLWVVHVLAIITAILVIVLGIMYITAYTGNNIKETEAKYNKAIENKCLIKSYVAPATYLRDYMKVLWDVCYPLGVALFIIAHVYLLIVLLAFIVRVAKKTSPCSPI